MRHLSQRLLVFATVGVVRAPIVPAQILARAATYAGNWQGKVVLDGVPHNVALLLFARDSTLSGTFSDNCWVVRDHICAEEGHQQIDRVRFVGDTLKFSLDALEFTGLAGGAVLRLTMSNPYDKSTKSFVAVKQPRASP